MKLKDTLTLIGSKLKVRKLRTIITIITASALYGIIITIFLVTYGFFNGIAHSADINLGKILLIASYPTPNLNTPEVRAEAIRLYNESTDPNKEYPVYTPDPILDNDGTPLYEFSPILVNGNSFAKAALMPRKTTLDQDAKNKIAALASPHGGNIVSILNDYYIGNDNEISFDKFEDGLLSFGSDVAVVDNAAISPLIKIKEQKDDVIQIVLPLNQAAQLVDIEAPRWSTSNSTKALTDYISAVNEQAIGYQFTGIIATDDQSETEVTYQIVGILPPERADSTDTPLSTIKNDYPNPNLNPLENTVFNLQRGVFMPYDFLVTNPNSTAFQSTYGLTIMNDFHLTNIVVEFDNIESALAFKADAEKICLDIDDGIDDCRPVGATELASNQLDIQATANSTNTGINVFTIIFTIVAAIIMIGTVSRVVSDERQTIALYRSVGASTKSILQVFSAYILTLCLLIITCATVIGLILSGVITAMNTATITANVAAMHNVIDPSPIIFIGFDPRIILIYLTIITIGILCLVVVMGRLTSKNIIKDLRKA